MKDQKKFIALVGFIRHALGYGLAATDADLENGLTVITAVVDSFLDDLARNLNADKAEVVKMFCAALIEGQAADKKEAVNENDLN